jgi:hypothetical protein
MEEPSDTAKWISNDSSLKDCNPIQARNPSRWPEVTVEKRTLLIEFDETWVPVVYVSSQNDKETERLKEIADRLIEAIREDRLDESL